MRRRRVGYYKPDFVMCDVIHGICCCLMGGISGVIFLKRSIRMGHFELYFYLLNQLWTVYHLQLWTIRGYRLQCEFRTIST